MEPGGVLYHGRVGIERHHETGNFRLWHTPAIAGRIVDWRTLCSAPAITRAQVPFWRDVNYKNGEGNRIKKPCAID